MSPDRPAADDDAPLVRQAQSGDFSAFSTLVEKYSPRVYTLALRIVRRPEDASEVVQDTFLSAIEHITDRAGVDRYMAGDAQWIGESHMIAFSCRHEGECLAIFLLFRDSKTPYTEGLLPQLKTVRDLFAQQLAKVIKIHHRHLPKEKWGALGDLDEPRGDDYGLAA